MAALVLPEWKYSIGYAKIQFKVVRPFVRMNYVSAGAPTGGWDAVAPGLNVDPSKKYARQLYWGVGIEGELAEKQDDLSQFKRSIEQGADPKRLIQKMKREKYAFKQITAMEQFCQEWATKKKRRG